MKNRFFIAILAMGFNGLVAEILLLRELLIVFSGNELCIGIILANWLIMEAIGCFFLGNKLEKAENQLEVFTVITILFSFSLFISIFLTRILKGVVGISVGESMGLLQIFYSSVMILLPVSILHGALFPFSCRIYSMFTTRDTSCVGRVYAYETIGTIIGGIVCTYLLIPYFNSFSASAGLVVLNFVVCLIVLAPHRNTRRFTKTIMIILSGLIIILVYLVINGQIDRMHKRSINAQWQNLNVVHYQNSQYGNICVVENQDQYIFFQDGIPNIITPVPDIQFIEEIVHIPLLAHPKPEKLLIVSGGAGGVINEALKHSSIKTIEYAELDPLLTDLFRKFTTPLTKAELNDSRVKIKQTDGRLLVKSTGDKYDLILSGIMNPSNLQSNRFFTKEFFSHVKTRLNEGGIFVLGAPGSLAYLNVELKNLNSCIFHTLASVFSYIRVIPGDGTNLFLSSDSREILTIDRMHMIERLDRRNIEADMIVPWYIENKLHHGWQDWFSDFIKDGSRKINSDFNPVGLYYSISYWNSLFAPSLNRLFRQFERINLNMVVLSMAGTLLLVFLFRLKKLHLFRSGVTLSILTTGFAGMIFDILLIFTFQSIYGYVFSWIGILVASFMAGAACGAMLISVFLERIKNSEKLFKIIELLIVCFSIGCPYIFLTAHEYLGSTSKFLFRLLFLVISLICGFLIGSQFPLANKIYRRNSNSLSKTAGLLYASDLLGGWFGGIIGAVVLLPVLGLVGTCITVGLLKLTSFIIFSTRKIRYP